MSDLPYVATPPFTPLVSTEPMRGHIEALVGKCTYCKACGQDRPRGGWCAECIPTKSHARPVVRRWIGG